MEETITAIDKAIGQCDYNAILHIFNGPWNRLGTGEQRSVASHFIQRAVVATAQSPAAHQQASSFVTNSLPMLLDTYQTALLHLPATVENAADTTLRRLLFQYLVEEQNDYGTAARILAGTRIHHESGVYQMAPTDAADLFVSVAECFLQQDDESIAEADAAVTKAGHYLAEAANNKQENNANVVSVSLWLRYKTTNARVLDANRKFSAAARSYHELSQHEAIDEQLQLLARAVTCTILDHSNQRYKVLAGLVGNSTVDGRVRDGTLANAMPEFAPHAEMAILMHRNQIVSPRLVHAVETTLADHQKAVTTTHHLTILQRSVVQHNLHAVSILYESIHLSTLAHILNIGGNDNNNNNKNNNNIKMAEQMTAQMIQEKGMSASIDAVDGMVDFHSSSTSGHSNDNIGGMSDPPTPAAQVDNDEAANDDVAWYRQLNATVHAIQAERKLPPGGGSSASAPAPPVVV